MGLFFTFLYIITSYLAPSTLFGDLAEYHLEVVIVLLAVIFTVPSIAGRGVQKWIQTWAIGAVCFAAVMSIVFTAGSVEHRRLF